MASTAVIDNRGVSTSFDGAMLGSRLTAGLSANFSIKGGTTAVGSGVEEASEDAGTRPREEFVISAAFILASSRPGNWPWPGNCDARNGIRAV